MAAAQPFDSNASAFGTYQSSPWGRLLHDVSCANVQRRLDGSPLRILDAGGGNGVEAIFFAAQGHTVAVLDPSVELLNQARRNAQTAGVAERMEFYEAELAAIPRLFPEAKFDLILCHNVLQYVEDVEEALRAIRQPLSPDGLISIICINRYSEPYREALQQLNPGAAYEKLDTRTIFSSVFKVPVRAYAAEEMSQTLQKVGCVVLAQYGVRCVYDYIPNDQKNDTTFLADLERLEYAISGKYPYYLLARFFQLIVGR